MIQRSIWTCGRLASGYVDGFDRIWQRGDLSTKDWHLESQYNRL